VTDPHKPFVLDVEAEADPAAAAPVPDVLTEAEGRAMQAAAQIAASGARRSAFTRFAIWVLGGLFSFVITVAAYDFVMDLLARNAVLGGVAFALFALAVVVVLGLALREWVGFARLLHLDRVRVDGETARQSGDLRAARATVGRLRRLYAGRAEVSWGLARLAEREGDILDADGLLGLAETELLSPLDDLARAEVEQAARRVALVTALVPIALADVAAALFANLRMIRRIAEIYGGRTGTLGSWRLLRRVFTGLLATGALALGDDLIGSVAGGGVLSKLSRRFGEGLVNAALTARVGIAAMEACRPLAFQTKERPAVSALVARALKGVVG
jgi:putative membrane protein